MQYNMNLSPDQIRIIVDAARRSIAHDYETMDTLPREEARAIYAASQVLLSLTEELKNAADRAEFYTRRRAERAERAANN